MSFDIIIKKANGEREGFNPEKLKDSLRLAGASEEEIDKVLYKVEKILYHDITTKKIYREAFNELKDIKKSVAISYSLNEAVMELGPTGFPFEKFIGKIFSKLGYKTEVGIMMAGACIEHEVDLLVKHDSHIFIAETKFHNEHGIKSNLQTSLYVKARFDDLWESPFLSKENKPHSVWLITNTKFTNSALTYGECAGITMISWNHPKNGNLQNLIEKSRLHPVTAISSLSKSEKSKLLQNDIVLCRDLIENFENLASFGVHSNKHQQILDEATLITNIKID
jgi:hypothetical protein